MVNVSHGEINIEIQLKIGKRKFPIKKIGKKKK